MIRLAMPEAGIAWPIIDLTEPMTGVVPCSRGPPKKRASVSSSVTSPAVVPVPCASTRPMSSREMPACPQAFSSASSWPVAEGATRLLLRPSLDEPLPSMTA
nr:hypothetical protein [Hydrocarboniphaga effusa]